MTSSMLSDRRADATGAPRRARRWLWLRIAGGVAVVEAILVAVGVIPAPVAIAVAAAALLLYFGTAKRASSARVRQAAWALAVSQALLLFVPLVVALVGWLLILAVATVGLVLLAVLVLER